MNVIWEVGWIFSLASSSSITWCSIVRHALESVINLTFDINGRIPKLHVPMFTLTFSLVSLSVVSFLLRYKTYPSVRNTRNESDVFGVGNLTNSSKVHLYRDSSHWIERYNVFFGEKLHLLCHLSVRDFRWIFFPVVESMVISRQ